MALLTCVNLISWFAFHPKGAAVAVMQLTLVAAGGSAWKFPMGQAFYLYPVVLHEMGHCNLAKKVVVWAAALPSGEWRELSAADQKMEQLC